MAYRKQKFQTTLALTNDLSIFAAAILVSLSLPVLITTYFHQPNHSTQYGQSTANLYALVVTFLLLAWWSSTKAVKVPKKHLKSLLTVRKAMVVLLALIIILNIYIAIAGLISTTPLAAETTPGWLFISICSIAALYFGAKSLAQKI
jgi:hypothetical protein